MSKIRDAAAYEQAAWVREDDKLFWIDPKHVRTIDMADWGWALAVGYRPDDEGYLFH